MTDTDDTEELRRKLRDVVRMRGADEVAAAIPADRATVFRFLAGETQRPTHAIREGMERVIDDQSQVRRFRP